MERRIENQLNYSNIIIHLEKAGILPSVVRTDDQGNYQVFLTRPTLLGKVCDLYSLCDWDHYLYDIWLKKVTFLKRLLTN